MTHKTLNTRHALESCTFQLHSWNPFHLQTLTKTLDSDLYPSSNAFRTKKPCLSDRGTAPPLLAAAVENLDMSKLTLFDDDRPLPPQQLQKRESFPWIARKRRRRGSRSVSGRSSDRSGTRRCCSVGAYATCSDFPVAVGTDSSGELFVNGGGGDANWASDVSEARNPRRDGKDVGGVERETSGGGSSLAGVFESQGNESGYGSEPGYRGDGEFGYGDEFDEEEEDGRVLFWGDRLGGGTDRMEVVGENTFSEQKAHHRCRRKKHDWRMVAPLSAAYCCQTMTSEKASPYNREKKQQGPPPEIKVKQPHSNWLIKAVIIVFHGLQITLTQQWHAFRLR